MKITPTLKGVTRGVLPRHNGGLCPPNPPRLAAGSTPRCSLRSHTYGVGGGSYWKVVWGLVKGVTTGGVRTRNKDVPKCVFYRNASLFSTTCSYLFPRVPNHMATGVSCMVNAYKTKYTWILVSQCNVLPANKDAAKYNILIQSAPKW